MSRRFLVTGAFGLLGPYLQDAAAAETVLTTGRDRGDAPCDLTDARAVGEWIRATRPDVVLHAAAMTDVDACERDPAAAFALNAEAVRHLVEALPETAALIYFSTDQVYPDTEGPHGEETAEPINTYGRTKLAGENEALRHPRGLALRTNLFGRSRTVDRSSLSDFVTRGLADGKSITLFDDILFSPLHMVTLSELAVEASLRGLTGCYNLGCRRGASKAAFGLAVADHLGLDASSATVGPSPPTSPDRAPRPRDMRLAVNKIEDALGRSMPTLSEEIAKL